MLSTAGVSLTGADTTTCGGTESGWQASPPGCAAAAGALQCKLATLHAAPDRSRSRYGSCGSGQLSAVLCVVLTRHRKAAST
jgi:hypothetical protein